MIKIMLFIHKILNINMKNTFNLKNYFLCVFVIVENVNLLL